MEGVLSKVMEGGVLSKVMEGGKEGESLPKPSESEGGRDRLLHLFRMNDQIMNNRKLENIQNYTGRRSSIDTMHANIILNSANNNLM